MLKQSITTKIYILYRNVHCYYNKQLKTGYFIDVVAPDKNVVKKASYRFIILT